MSVRARVAMTAAATAALVGTALVPAAAQPTLAKDAKHTYTCSNKGGGPNHTVNCTGLITVNNILNNTTLTVGDVNVLTDLQLKDLDVTLARIADNNVNTDLRLQLLKLRGTVIDTYLQHFDILLDAGKVKICALSICA
ncbi:preprotein translocase subunit TatB [Streptomyces canus]|uniref:preprotein translocase subunit TatB n=1 Tax=Streptomyces canus TaxID=58343 RepID=UPI0033CC056B